MTELAASEVFDKLTEYLEGLTDDAWYHPEPDKTMVHIRDWLHGYLTVIKHEGSVGYSIRIYTHGDVYNLMIDNWVLGTVPSDTLYTVDGLDSLNLILTADDDDCRIYRGEYAI